MLECSERLNCTNKIQHPHLLKIVDKNLGWHWFVTEYQAGGTLEHHIEKYRGNLLAALTAIRPIAEAVSKMHEAGTVHRDIKPGNIFIGSAGELILGDAGLVFFVDDKESRLTSIYESIGTDDYMPEWVREPPLKTVPMSMDVFALDKVIWAMVAGRPTCRLWHVTKPQNELETMFPDDPSIRWARFILDRTVVEEESDCIDHAGHLLVVIDKAIQIISRGGNYWIRLGHARAGSVGRALSVPWS